MAKRTTNIEREVIKYLTEQGERIIKSAYNRRRWKNRTYNLHDSFGSAVYKNGFLLRDTIKYVSESELANARKNDKELGNYQGQRTRAQRGSSFREFGKVDKPARFINGDTIQAYGRDEVKKFFNSYEATKNGIELVVVAAMYYAGILESGKYQVISSSTTDLNNMAKLLGDGVEVYALDIERDREEVVSSKSFKIVSKTRLN